MAYAAAVSLVQILNKLLHSDQLSIPYQKSQIESLHEKVCFLQSFLKEKSLEPDNVRSLAHEFETQIIDAISEAEDIIESHMSIHLLPPESKENSSGDQNFPHKLLQVLQRFDSIKDAVSRTLKNIDHGGEDRRSRALAPFLLSRYFGRNYEKLVGREDIITKIINQLTQKRRGPHVIGVVGMVGIGKTALVNKVYNHPSVTSYFTYRAWGSVGSRSNVRDILESLLQREYHNPGLSDKGLGYRLEAKLMEKRYLIVLDDIRDVDTWDELSSYFPGGARRGRVIITTRLREVARDAAGTKYVHQVSFLDENKSWDLLRHTAMGQKPCPVNLEKIGKTIAQNCQGLPLKIMALGNLLSRKSLDPESWSMVADNHEVQNHEMLKVTQYLDHDQLPQHVKACFLYMAAFPLYQQIPAWKLLKLWIAEGFLEPNEHKILELVAEECLVELDNRSLILVHELSFTGRIKTCSIHSAIWPFYERAAVQHKVFQAIRNYKEGADPTHRRLSIYKNVLFAIKDVYESLACISNMRSLLCTGPYHPYSLHVILRFRLLRVLDALSIRFYQFPDEILKLVLLRFLAFTINRGELPASLSNLGQLQFLIVRQHSSIKSCGARSFIPIEIWYMKELRHLQVMGGDVPSPFDHMNALLPSLLTLLDVGTISCTREVLERTPNLMKLGVRIELDWSTEAAVAPLQHLFDHLAILDRLETFKCVVTNPFIGTHAATLPRLFFPLNLKKLTLSGCGLPWESLKTIAQLPDLEVLKLRCHALRGPKWELEEDEFNKLRFLLLEDLDIEQWVGADSTKFWSLERLAIHHCYKLREIPIKLASRNTLETIDLVGCSPSVVESAMRIKEEQEHQENDDFQLRIESAWTDIGRSRKSKVFA